MEASRLRRILRATTAALLLLGPQQARAATLGWEDFWSKALSTSPKVKALSAQTEQARARVALEIAPPMVAIGTQGMDNPFNADMEQTFEVTQKIPFPTKFVTAAQVKAERVRQSELEADTLLLDQKFQAYQQFVDLNELLARKQLLADKRDFYQEHLKRLRAYTISNQLQQLHILEVEAMLRDIDLDLRGLSSEERGLRLKLGSWIAGAGQVFSDDPTLAALALERAAPASDVTQSPYLKLSQSAERVRDREVSLARSSWLPDIALTYRRHIRRDNVMPSSNEVMLGLELPFVFPGQPAARSSEASFAREEFSLQNSQRELDLAAQADALRVRVDALRDELKLMRSEILPNLEKRMHLLHRLSQSDMESIEQHRSTYDQMLAAQEKNLRLESDYRKALMELEILNGGGK